MKYAYKQDRAALQEFIDSYFLPQYDSLTIWGHGLEHIKAVERRAYMLAQCFNSIDLGLLMLAVKCHDLGLNISHKYHHEIGSDIILGETELQQWFSWGELKMAANAVYTHRSSNTEEPASIYGKILADADRDVDPVEATSRFLLSNHTMAENNTCVLPTVDQAYDLMITKYGDGGRGERLWLNHPMQVKGLDDIRAVVDSRDIFYPVYKKAVALSVEALFC